MIFKSWSFPFIYEMITNPTNGFPLFKKKQMNRMKWTSGLIHDKTSKCFISNVLTIGDHFKNDLSADRRFFIGDRRNPWEPNWTVPMRFQTTRWYADHSNGDRWLEAIQRIRFQTTGRREHAFFSGRKSKVTRDDTNFFLKIFKDKTHFFCSFMLPFLFFFSLLSREGGGRGLD